MRPRDRRPTDYRRQRRRQERQLLVLVVVALVFIGGALIVVFYGWVGLLTGLPWLLGGAGILLALFLLLALLERWTNR
jgi:fatty acid desaturase